MIPMKTASHPHCWQSHRDQPFASMVGRQKIREGKKGTKTRKQEGPKESKLLGKNPKKEIETETKKHLLET